MMEKNELPKGWEIKKLGEVCETTSGGTPSRKDPNFYNGHIPWVKSGELDKGLITDTEEKITEAAIKNSSAKIFPKGTLLIALYGATIGKLAFLGIDAATNQAVCGIFESEKIDPKYLYQFLFFSKADLVKQGIGGAQPNISQGILKNLDIPIPPLPEQHRIVAKIEALFSQLDNGIAQLKTAQAQLKVYRQAVLKWAFEGNEDETNLLKDVSEKIQIGPFGSQLHQEDYIENGIPLINPMHLKDGEILPDFKYSISISKRDSLPNYILKAGDVIMGRRGEMGRCGLVTEKENGWFCGTGSLFVRPRQRVDSTFLYYQLRSDHCKKYLELNAGGTTMTNLNLKIVSSIPIFIPSLEEQHRIVQEIESRLSVCDKLEETITQALQQSEALRQSILKRAFEGKLVK
ncbi:MAG: restriction endonuclease subunit S [Haliscomenobacteraceae bacterium CHB4]|nr:Type-1 restriction enzyme EcoKI specificity protein [Saprospiraceae bacterium]MCE7922193.1 restriction endonuclease subunit S [Haliscomenobacteraceae bacterium CHB4]